MRISSSTSAFAPHTSANFPSEVDSEVSDGNVLCADPRAQIGVLLIEAAQKAREAAATQQKAAERMQEASERMQIQAMRDEASTIRTSGWVQGMCDVASGAAQFLSAFKRFDADGVAAAKELSGDPRTIEQGCDTAQLTNEMAALADYHRTLTRTSAIAAATAMSIEGLGKGVCAELSAGQADARTEQRENEINAQHARRDGERASEMRSHEDQQIDKTLDFMKTCMDLKHQTMMALTQGIRA